MATPRSQRVAIWIIAVVLGVGTIGSFFVLIISNQNQTEKSNRMQQETTEFQEQYQKNQQAWASELSDKYFKQFSDYKTKVNKFDSKSVDKLETKDLKKGSGEEVSDDTSYHAYYIGWNPRGVIFDSSIEDKSLRAPLEVTPASGLIEGWKQGVKGMKKGGVRLLTIPSDLGYGAQSQGDDIPANTPLKFIVMIIEDPEPVEVPEISDELSRYLMQQQPMQ